MAEYVLDPFTREERPPAAAMVEQAKDACLCVLTDGLQKAMNIYNKSLDV
jgi:peptidyl-tRNA hydrolase